MPTCPKSEGGHWPPPHNGMVPAGHMLLRGVLKRLLNSLNIVCQIINDQLCCLQLLHSLFDIHLHIHYAVFMPTFLSFLSCQMVFHVNFSLITFCAILKKCLRTLCSVIFVDIHTTHRYLHCFCFDGM